MEEEILLTPTGTYRQKFRMTEMTMVEEEACNLRETLWNTLKVIETRLWISWSPSRGL